MIQIWDNDLGFANDDFLGKGSDFKEVQSHVQRLSLQTN